MIDHETSAGEYVAAQDDGRFVGFKTNHLEDGQVGVRSWGAATSACNKNE